MKGEPRTFEDRYSNIDAHSKEHFLEHERTFYSSGPGTTSSAILGKNEDGRARGGVTLVSSDSPKSQSDLFRYLWYPTPLERVIFLGPEHFILQAENKLSWLTSGETRRRTMKMERRTTADDNIPQYNGYTGFYQANQHRPLQRLRKCSV